MQCIHQGCDPFVLIKFHRIVLFISISFFTLCPVRQFVQTRENFALLIENGKQWNMGQLWMVVGPSKRKDKNVLIHASIDAFINARVSSYIAFSRWSLFKLLFCLRNFFLLVSSLLLEWNLKIYGLLWKIKSYYQAVIDNWILPNKLCAIIAIVMMSVWLGDLLFWKHSNAVITINMQSASLELNRIFVPFLRCA